MRIAIDSPETCFQLILALRYGASSASVTALACRGRACDAAYPAAAVARNRRRVMPDMVPSSSRSGAVKAIREPAGGSPGSHDSP